MARFRCYTNEKKVRGWKGQVRRVEQLRERHVRLDVDRIAGGGEASVGLWIDPWYRIVRRQPPFWLRRLMLKALIDVHDSWRATLTELGEPFHLRLWLVDPRFMKTELYATTRDMREYEQGRVLDPLARPVPPPQYDSPLYDLSRFRWEAEADEDSFFLWEFDDHDEREAVIRASYRTETVPGAGTAYRIRRGTAWVGHVP